MEYKNLNELMTWYEAKKLENANWRLPTMDELREISHELKGAGLLKYVSSFSKTVDGSPVWSSFDYDGEGDIFADGFHLHEQCKYGGLKSAMMNVILIKR